MKYIFISFILIFSSALVANDEFLGEKNFDHYYGPHNPILRINHYNQKIGFTDDYNKKLYFNSKFQNEFFDLKAFLDIELAIGLYCPEKEYNERKEYLRYLTRLLVTSYLFEALREYEYTSKQIGLKNSCIVNWKKTFNSCKPKTNEMKVFVKNTKHIVRDIREILVPYEKSTKDEVSRWFSDLGNKNYKSLGQYRLGEECSGNECKSPEKVNQKMNEFCVEDIDLIKDICSEHDNLMGQSHIPEIYSLLVRSLAINSANDTGYSSGCLRRFIELNKNKENEIPQLKNIFSFLYSKNIENVHEYERGKLFAIGSLKEFREKGLESIFEEKKIIMDEKVTPKIAKNLVKPKFEKIVLPKLKKKKKIVKKKKVRKIKKIKKIKQSTFLIASTFRRRFDYDKVNVDMKKFKYDYTFTLTLEKSFKPIVERFSSQKSLKEMLKFDKLGTIKAPIPLKFLKFLIDKKMHQGLFNIINVLGNRFYVKNDLDPKVLDLEFINISNDKSTSFQWKVDILKPNK